MSQGLCPSCGAGVNLTAEQNEVNCTYCATLVKRPEAEAQFNEVKNSKVSGTLLIADTSREGGSFEEAITFYNKVIEAEPTFAGAWLNKGICMLQTSKIAELKTTEAISSWKAAIKFSKDQSAMKKRVAKEILKTVRDFYPVLENHYKEYSHLPNAYAEHVSRFIKLENALALALEYDPLNGSIPAEGINLCSSVLSCLIASGTRQAISSLASGDWRSALDKAATTMDSHSSVKDSVVMLKAKYELALASVNPSFKVSGLPPDVESRMIGTKAWEHKLLEPFRSLKQQTSGLFGSKEQLSEYISFFCPTETSPAVILFASPNISSDALLVTKDIIGIGVIGKPKKGFFSIAVEEKKIVITPNKLMDVTYTAPKGFAPKPVAPVIHYLNDSGVTTLHELKSDYFLTETSEWGEKMHRRPKALVHFLNLWKANR